MCFSENENNIFNKCIQEYNFLIVEATSNYAILTLGWNDTLFLESLVSSPNYICASCFSKYLNLIVELVDVYAPSLDRQVFWVTYLFVLSYLDLISS